MFRGNDFNLEAKGYVPGRKPGSWVERPRPAAGTGAKLESCKLRNVNTAIHCRSPAILSVYPDAKTALQELNQKRRAQQQKSKRVQSARSRPMSAASSQRENLALLEEKEDVVHAIKPTCEPGSVGINSLDLGPLTFEALRAPPKQRAARPQTAGVARSRTINCNERPQTATVRSRASRKGASKRGSAVRHGKDPEKKQFVTSQNRPWSAHENWRPKLSWL